MVIGDDDHFASIRRKGITGTSVRPKLSRGSQPGFPDLVGYNAFTHAVRNYSAVTAACMATRQEVLEAVGGLDERLPIDYNDVDFCLKAIERGYRVVYTPHAELLHFEGSSIPRATQNPREVALFRERWALYLQCDPHYNPNLMRRSVDFSIDPEVANWPANG